VNTFSTGERIGPMSDTTKPSTNDIEALRRFLSWGAKQSGFPYGSVGYWVDAYAKGDGKTPRDRDRA
jgi:hypothetical protein